MSAPACRVPPSAWLLALLVLGVLGLWRWREIGLQSRERADSGRVESRTVAGWPDPEGDSLFSAGRETLTPEEQSALVAKLRARLGSEWVRSGEAILTFRDEAAYRRFLARAMHAGAEVSGRIDGLLAVRVRVRDYARLIEEMAENIADYVSVSANTLVTTPPPPKEQRAEGEVRPVDSGLLSLIEARGEARERGRGVLIAILDGGVAPDAAFGARLRYLDIGYGVVGLAEDTRHGTAVAAIAAGAAPDVPGVAPAAELLSIRVVGPDGKSDAFSVAQGIVAAVDAGARVINISLGGYATVQVLGSAVDYALADGVALVAASGNDQVERVVWPAAYPGVVSVGAVDAGGRQALFSNSGETLQLTAPGVGVRTVAAGGGRFLFSGTSASAPVVAGALAALLSQNTELDAIQAADLLVQYSNDAGVAGADPDYGRGIVNLGWALEWAESSRVDPALATQDYDAGTRTLTFVVQNRSGRAAGDLRVAVRVGTKDYQASLPELAAGETTRVKIHLESALSDAETPVKATLLLPPGMPDQNTANNELRGLIRGRP